MLLGVNGTARLAARDLHGLDGVVLDSVDGEAYRYIYQYEADMNRDRCGLFHPLGGLHSTTKRQLHGGEACKGQKSRDGGLRL
jgi:hypothetical protein